MSASCGHVAAARDRCRCGHIAELHGLTDAGRRTACSVSTGRDATPCGCPAYTPEVTR